MSASGWIHVDIELIKKETEKAFLIVVDDNDIWVPKFSVSDHENYSEGDEDITLSIRENIAKEKGLV